MVSAREALRSAIRDGYLKRKRRAGYWTKRQFILTRTHFMHFESMDAKEPTNALSTMEIHAVRKRVSDPQQRIFTLKLFRKKKVYRAKTTEERDLWMEALESVSGMKGIGAVVAPGRTKDMDNETDMTGSNGVESTDDNERKESVQDIQNMDIQALCEQMKHSFTRQIQISRSFWSNDVVKFVKQTFPQLSMAQIQELGQHMIDDKMIVPLKSHFFRTAESGRFKFAEHGTPKVPNSLSPSHQFNARKYAHDFLRKQSMQTKDSNCKKRGNQKENIEDVHEDIDIDDTAFIREADEIQRMENSISQLKTQVFECQRKICALKSTALEVPSDKGAQLDSSANDATAEKRKQSMRLDKFICDLDVYLYERNYEEFTHRMLEYKRKQAGGTISATDAQQSRIDNLRQEFIEKLVDEFNTSLQTSERIHNKASHLDFLIQLGEAQLATNICLQNYSVRIALQLRYVPCYGNALNYVINFSRTFFSSLLVCYEDFKSSFREQKSSHFVSLTVWISAQLEHFANELTYHIFPVDPTNASLSPDLSAMASSPSCVAIDVSDLKSIAKYVSSALRFVFDGSRQLEVSGLPTAHALAPHLAQSLISFISSYCVAIKNTMKEEIKRERWEMVAQTIRDADTQLEQEIVLTHSVRLFYAMVQQFLRDVQRVLNPSCATSSLPEVHDVIVSGADDLLGCYNKEALQYLQSPKLSSSLRPKHIVGMLTNAACIQNDCLTRCTKILQEYLPPSALEDRKVEHQVAALLDQLMAVGIERYAQSLMKLSFCWQELDLAAETLVELPGPSVIAPRSSLFASVLLKELSDTVANKELNKALENRALASVVEASWQGTDTSTRSSFPILVLDKVVRGMLDDEVWWQGFHGQKGTARKHLGFGGLNRFLAEVDVLRTSLPLNEGVEESMRQLRANLLDLYQQLHPGKQELRAPVEWIQSYKHQCTMP